MTDSHLDNLVWWRRLIARITLGAVALGLVLVATSFVMSWIKREQLRDTHREVVAPSLERLRDGSPDTRELEEAHRTWLAQQQSLNRWLELRGTGFLTLFGALMFGVVTSMALDRAIHHRLARPDRPAATGAGEVARKLAHSGKTVIASSPPPLRRSLRWIWVVAIPVVFVVLLLLQLYAERPWFSSLAVLGFVVVIGGIWFLSELMRTGGGRQSIEIDPASGRIMFRQFTFLRHFMRNPTQTEQVLHATDILHLEPRADNHGRAVTVRTTQGQVVIFDRLQNFEQVVALLADFAEANRLDPAAYRAALAREPQLKTPWWGWLLLIGLSVGIVAVISWLVMRLA